MHVGEQAATPIAVYPNPTSGMLTLQGLSALTNQRIEIRDAQGKLVFDQERPATGATWVSTSMNSTAGVHPDGHRR